MVKQNYKAVDSIQDLSESTFNTSFWKTCMWEEVQKEEETEYVVTSPSNLGKVRKSLWEITQW